jgi:signal transduction histidine kinase
LTAVVANPNWATYRLPLEQGCQSAAAVPGHRAADERLLMENAKWFCSLRWLVAAAFFALGLAGPAVTGRLALHGIRLEGRWPLAVAGLLAVLNLAYLALFRVASRSRRPGVLAMRFLWLQILFDLALLTVVVHYLGSVESYAPVMYLFHVVLACIFFRYAHSLLVALSAVGMYLACIALETAGLVAPTSILAGSPVLDRGAAPPAVVAWQAGSVVFITGTVWYLASRLAFALRQREEELAEINQRLVAATEERAKHMLRTTHQLKAPFAAIHANAQLLLGGYCGPLPASAAAVIEQISARCETLSREIKEMLQLANLRSSAQSVPPPVEVDLAALVESCLANLRAEAGKREVRFAEDLRPAPARVIQDHAVMILENILSNAVIYSHRGGTVWVSCRPGVQGGAVVTVRDQGIGITAEKLPRIFEDYFRTNEAASHNRASTGLGLAIVRQAALAGQVGIRVESAPGQGTVFEIEFPASVADLAETNQLRRA